jgi:hypothetical protein
MDDAQWEPPGTYAGRFFAGAVAITIPRIIAVNLGLIQVSGGRGLWSIAEIDTLFFNAVLLVALFFLWRAIRERQLANPLLWHVVLMTVLIAGPIAYAISNFGTLLRHREMIFIGLSLIPLAVSLGSLPTRKSADSIVGEHRPVEEASATAIVESGAAARPHDKGELGPDVQPSRSLSSL